MPSPEPVTFALAHGAFHNHHVWDRLRQKLEDYGHNTVAMDLPIDDSGANLDTYAEVIAEAVQGRPNPVLVGHSRMGRAIPRVPQLTEVKGLVYINALIQPARDQEDFTTMEPIALFEDYVKGRLSRKDSTLVDYDKRRAWVFYSDFDSRDSSIEADESEVQAIIDTLRPQNSVDDAEPLLERPRIPTYSILSTEDMVVNPDYSRYAAMAYLGTTALEMPGGHSPFLLRPTLLAAILHTIVSE
jgi:pimeloyl-ACP methyl ester carboxylesterase